MTTVRQGRRAFRVFKVIKAKSDRLALLGTSAQLARPAQLEMLDRRALLG